MFPKEMLHPDWEVCTDSAVQRERDGKFKILGPEKEKEQWPNVSSLIHGIERNPAWAKRTNMRGLSDNTSSARWMIGKAW